MVRYTLMSLLMLAGFASDALAQGLFRRPSAKPDAAEYVPALIKTLQTDADERKREAAAEELRHYDTKTFPDMMPALIEALKNDPSHSVRHEAVNTIGKLRPVSQPGGFALEQAAANDSSFRVRTAAKSTLVQWSLLHGYRQGRAADSVQNQTEEPPLAPPLAKSGTTSKSGPIIPASVAPPEKMDPVRPVPPPLMPSPSKPFLSRSLFQRSGNKPETKDDGPVLNPPK